MSCVERPFALNRSAPARRTHLDLSMAQTRAPRVAGTPALPPFPSPTGGPSAAQRCPRRRPAPRPPLEARDNSGSMATADLLLLGSTPRTWDGLLMLAGRTAPRTAPQSPTTPSRCTGTRLPFTKPPFRGHSQVRCLLSFLSICSFHLPRA